MLNYSAGKYSAYRYNTHKYLSYSNKMYRKIQQK